ncbi:Dyp-type peroxidase [Prauserella cavernicola]|uniref:Dyp-type peroxidase n=1 Tax=Prauserella cavernicola TaxID=2800127 RepID=A0A934QVD4_9PSEU|nr:Dyp-type peroxidase [Prauserella cavernicola]MBK1786917.1 Dyp-type peroxidase [Prauserella cavernicola]
MPVELTRPLSWKTAQGDDAALLDELQPNIVKAHVRDHLSVLFVRFGDAAEGRGFLRALAGSMKSAKSHLEEIEAFKAAGTGGTPYLGVGLSNTGYEALGITTVPADTSFRQGMRDPVTKDRLGDPPRSSWDVPYREGIDAVVLVGAATDAALSRTRNAVLDLVTDTITVLGEETGLSRVNASGEGIEHFGYVDGRSQPLFLTEDIEAEKLTTDGTTAWDPSAPLGQVLVADPAAPDPSVHFGSYFVFRKLEQNVRRFKQAESDLADALGLTGRDRDRAGAMLVGRFEDGTPLTSNSAHGCHSPVANDFGYGSDELGRKCPFHAHIRKTNPRGSGGFEDPAREHGHLMARRGQTYGERADDPNGDLPIAARPVGGVGLLFMAFNSDLGDQFEFTQQVWANNTDFPRVPAGTKSPGLDLVIGQGPRPETTYAPGWGRNGTTPADPAPQAVTMRGGEYFFMPSLAFLRNL